MKKSLSKVDILRIAKQKGGKFVVDRNKYRQHSLRRKLKEMSKGKEKVMRFVSMDQETIVYEVVAPSVTLWVSPETGEIKCGS